MRFKYYEVSWDDDNTGDGNMYVLTDTLKDVRRITSQQAEYEASANMDDNGRVCRSDFTTVAVQEMVLTGTPKEVASAALMVTHGESVAWSDTSSIRRGAVEYGRRWNVTYGNKFVLSNE